ncbi:unnamed protein product, partial [Urochloa humidicola]
FPYQPRRADDYPGRHQLPASTPRTPAAGSPLYPSTVISLRLFVLLASTAAALCWYCVGLEWRFIRTWPFGIDFFAGRGKVFRRSSNRKMNKGKIFKLAKGFRGRAKNCIRIARERVEKALQYSYRDRRNKKRDMRSLWIERINAGTRLHGVNYGNFMHGLVKENIQLNRKVLSELSMHETCSFKALVDVSRTAFPGNRPVKKEGLAAIL